MEIDNASRKGYENHELHNSKYHLLDVNPFHQTDSLWVKKLKAVFPEGDPKVHHDYPVEKNLSNVREFAGALADNYNTVAAAVNKSVVE